MPQPPKHPANFKHSDDEKQIWSVSQLNQAAKTHIEGAFFNLHIEGEIAEITLHRSGHWYFTLKDDEAQLSCAMFRFSNQSVRFRPNVGQHVLLTGKLSLYEPRGSFQFIAQTMVEAGLGKLQQAFEALKAQLTAEGLFDNANKQSLPTHASRIAIITSQDGAALRDIIVTFRRRSPYTELFVIPSTVQGTSAVASLVNAIDYCNRIAASHQLDAIIIGRGGGSIEDLWSFNSEQLARSIHRSELPIISAVGHETDVTIADFVADARAATPTAAAEMLSIDKTEVIRRFQALENRLSQQIQARLSIDKQTLAHIQRRIRHPSERLRQMMQRLDELDIRAQQAWKLVFSKHVLLLKQQTSALQHHAPAAALAQKKQRLLTLTQTLKSAIKRHIERSKTTAGQAASNLHLVSPLQTLQRGYAIISDEQSHIIRSVKKHNKGDAIIARLSDGQLFCQIENIEHNTD